MVVFVVTVYFTSDSAVVTVSESIRRPILSVTAASMITAEHSVLPSNSSYAFTKAMLSSWSEIGLVSPLNPR